MKEYFIQEYETPLFERQIISKDRVRVIFQHIHEILQCHELFSIALSDLISQWRENPNIGDVIYASVSAWNSPLPSIIVDRFNF